MKESFPASICLHEGLVQNKALRRQRDRCSCRDSPCDELDWHQVLAATWYHEGPETGLLESSRPGVVGIGEGKPVRGVVCEVPTGVFQSHWGGAMLGSDMDRGQGSGSGGQEGGEGALGAGE